MEIGANVDPKPSTGKIKRYVHGSGPKTVKSHSRQWVEEDMTMDIEDTTNDCTEQEVGQDYSTWDEYFEKIIVYGYSIFCG